MKNKKIKHNTAGKPAYYTSPEELEAKIDEYFEKKVSCEPFLDKEGNPCYSKQGKILYDVKPPTVAGLSLYLGFADRRSLYDYKNRVEYSHVIKRAVTKIEEYAEIQLTQGNPTGAIFWLKNHNWTDQTTQEIVGKDGGSIIVDNNINVDIDKLKSLKELLR
jgi:hypothetical protein